MTATNATGTLAFTYDKRGRVKIATSQSPNHPIPQSLRFAYDAAGNRTTLTHPDGFTVLFHYDALNRLTGLDFGGGSEPFPYPSPSPSPDPSLTAMLQFVYDALSRRMSLRWPTGLLTRYGYDAANRLLTLLISRGRTTLLSVASTYDELGNRKTLADPTGLTTYTYDLLSQLKTVDAPPSRPDVTYTYDAVGNRLKMTQGAITTAYTPNRLNQYDAVGSTTLRHEKNGNLTFDGSRTYAYDSANRLLGVTAPRLSAAYAYDALGRRVSKTVNGVTTTFLYDGDQLIADLDASGKIVARYVYGPGIDEPLVMLRGGKRYYFHADGLGSIVALTDDRGQVIERYTYDAFGQPTILAPDGTVRTTSIVGNRFLFTGREYDFETGLYYYRQRYYHPGLGRFVSREPEPTDPNLYRYVNNNPTSWIDPLGTNLLSPLPTQGLMPGIEGTAGISSRSPPVAIDVPITSPEGISDWTPPFQNPPVGPDLIPQPAVGTEAGQKIREGKPVGLQPADINQQPGVLMAKGVKSVKRKDERKLIETIEQPLPFREELAGLRDRLAKTPPDDASLLLKVVFSVVRALQLLAGHR